MELVLAMTKLPLYFKYGRALFRGCLTIFTGTKTIARQSSVSVVKQFWQPINIVYVSACNPTLSEYLVNTYIPVMSWYLLRLTKRHQSLHPRVSECRQSAREGVR